MNQISPIRIFPPSFPSHMKRVVVAHDLCCLQFRVYFGVCHLRVSGDSAGPQVAPASSRVALELSS
jgi:hypothetical protein